MPRSVNWQNLFNLLLIASFRLLTFLILLIHLFLPQGIIHPFQLLNSIRNRRLKQVEHELAIILTHWLAWYCIQTSSYLFVSCSFLKHFLVWMCLTHCVT